MAQIDFTLTDTQYNQLVSTTDALLTKLASIKPALTSLLSQETGKEKLKTFLQNNPTDGRLIIKTIELYTNLRNFKDEIGWE